MRGKELADRKKILAKFPWGESIHPVKYKLVKADGVIAAIKEMTTSEGAMIKDASSRYDRSGEGWYKWKQQYEIDAQVVAVDSKPDGYIYTCKVGNVTIGDTYLTQVKANVGVGKVYVQDGKLKAKARIYNTSTVPDMVKRVRLGLVRDVSIEGIARRFQRICNGGGCWQRAFGLVIHRAVFVSAGADPLAKIEKILESIEGDKI